jgi:hypothetical protein
VALELVVVPAVRHPDCLGGGNNQFKLIRRSSRSFPRRIVSLVLILLSTLTFSPLWLFEYYEQRPSKKTGQGQAIYSGDF